MQNDNLIMSDVWFSSCMLQGQTVTCLKHIGNKKKIHLCFSFTGIQAHKKVKSLFPEYLQGYQAAYWNSFE